MVVERCQLEWKRCIDRQTRLQLLRISGSSSFGASAAMFVFRCGK